MKKSRGYIMEDNNNVDNQDFQDGDIRVVTYDGLGQNNFDDFPKVDIYDEKRNKAMFQKFINAGNKGGEKNA